MCPSYSDLARATCCNLPAATFGVLPRGWKSYLHYTHRHSNDEEYKDIFFAKIDVDELPELSQELGIKAMPTFMIFKDGEKADELVGANPNALVQLLQKNKETV